jgi:hypothetical protein
LEIALTPGIGKARKWRRTRRTWPENALAEKSDSFGGIVDGHGFLSTTDFGEHNNLFANFGYVGVREGISLKF